MQFANPVCNFGHNEHLNKTQVKIYLNHLDKTVYSRMTRDLPSADLSPYLSLTQQPLISTKDEVEKKDFDRQKRSKRRIPQRHERTT